MSDRVSTIAEAIEPFDKVWGVGASGRVKDPSPFPRINKILDGTEKTTNGEVVPERAMIMTRVYKELQPKGLQHILIVAEAMAAVLRETPIYIYDNELIVGTQGCKKKNAPVFPEFGLNWLLDEMENGLLGYSENRTHDYFTHTEETYKELKSIQDFWEGHCVEQRLMPILTDDEIKGSHIEKGLFLCNGYIFCGAGHLGVNYDRLFKMGYGGIAEEIKAEMAKINITKPEDIARMNSLKADLIMNEAASDFILRHAMLAREMAAKESDATRQAELELIADNCEQIAKGILTSRERKIFWKTRYGYSMQWETTTPRLQFWRRWKS